MALRDDNLRHYAEISKGFQKDRINALDGDEQRWRWLMLFTLSDSKTFPGLLGKLLDPMGDLEIIGSVYTNSSFRTDIGLAHATWKKDLEKFVAVGLVDKCWIGSRLYYWNANFHCIPNKYRPRTKGLDLRFYQSFLELSDPKEKAVFVLLLEEFRPEGIDPLRFGIPRVSDALMNLVSNGGGAGLLFDDSGVEQIKRLMIGVDARVTQFVKQERRKEGVEGYKEFVDYFAKKYEKVYGKPYVFEGEKDGAMVKRLLKVFKYGDLTRLLDEFFASKDKFLEKTGHRITAFGSMVNRLGKKKRQRRGNWEWGDHSHG
jgi:hypothetical protein